MDGATQGRAQSNDATDQFSLRYSRSKSRLLPLPRRLKVLHKTLLIRLKNASGKINALFESGNLPSPSLRHQKLSPHRVSCGTRVFYEALQSSHCALVFTNLCIAQNSPAVASTGILTPDNWWDGEAGPGGWAARSLIED